MIDLTNRVAKDELMDDPLLDVEDLKDALLDLNKINKVLLGNKITLDAVHSLIKKNQKESYNIIDMGCGDGNMLRVLAIFLRKKGIKANLTGVDLSTKNLQIAKDKSTDFPEITYVYQDILALDPKDLNCDILLCTLVLHHFTTSQIHTFIHQFAKLSNIAVVINDLLRSRLSHYSFKIFRYLFLTSYVTKHDGLASVNNGFKKPDLLSFSQQLPQHIHAITLKYLFRYLWIIYK